MKISPEQKKKWEAMWKKWEKPLFQDNDYSIFADMEAAIPNWKKLVQKEFKGTLDTVHKDDFDNAIKIVLYGEDPKSKKKFLDNCMTFDRFLDTIRYVVQNDFHKFGESALNERYHTTVAGYQRDIDDDNPLKRYEPTDPDYMHLNSHSMDRIVALNVTPGDKHIGEILFIYRPKKLFDFNRAGYYRDDDNFLPVSRKSKDEMQKFLNSAEMQSMRYYNNRTQKISDFKIKLITFQTFIDKIQYKKGEQLVKNIAALDESEKIEEASFDQLDWKNGSLTGNGLKQAVDMFKAQDANGQTVVIYDRKTRKLFNIVDVHLGNAKSGHGLEIDIDTSKEVQTESDNMKSGMKNNSQKLFELYEKNGYDFAQEILSGIRKKQIGDGWWRNLSSNEQIKKFRDFHEKRKQYLEEVLKKNKNSETTARLLECEIYWLKGFDLAVTEFKKNHTNKHEIPELNEADDRDPLSHALDSVGVKASTANSKAQDEVQMSATDGDTYTGIDAAIDRDIDAAMEEIYR